ncbi:hypothetical protein CSC94_09950 [Zhengella mangrovi]|uniref:Cytochrome c domain-containing protein n=1 Tax=Zhengella mangrovi TaxID=1982044 RepID=A0A2G1QPG3_9HYPH|nr:cytochrome c [Zhengella mangrovi]PHP67351.1 hypothetical protein CSC94_09950 [Zhengella mangrovi]
MRHSVQTFLAVFQFGLVAALVPGGAQAADGKALFEDNCAACHMPAADVSHDDLVAPPIFGVVMNYRRAYGSDRNVADAISQWLEKPDEAKSVMPQWVARFGLMPPLELAETDRTAIANYIASADFDPPAQGRGMGVMGHGMGMGRGMMRGFGNQ